MTTTEEQLEQIWQSLQQRNETTKNEERQWPRYDQVQADIRAADYQETLQCTLDLHPQERTKALCPYGVVAKAKLELFDCPSSHRPYSGLLSPSSTLAHCLIRLSSAMKPPGACQGLVARTILKGTGEKLRTAKLFPTCAIKILRDDNNNNTDTASNTANTTSGNMLFMGSKVGQREEDYFTHCQCTQGTEQMPLVVKPLVKKFWNYSENPLALGLSNLAWTDASGTAVEPEELNFPYCLILRPRVAVKQQNEAKAAAEKSKKTDFSSFDSFLDDLINDVPEGTTLFDLYASPSPQSVPDASQLQRIGRITTTSPLIASSPSDGLFFQHQIREEDYTWRPDWKEASQTTQCSIDGTATTGSVEKLAGWKLFERHIAKGTYVDYENCNE